MFVHQGKCTKDLLKKFDMDEAKPLSTPMLTMMALDTDDEGAMDQKEYRSMTRSLLYLTMMRPDIQFMVCVCVLSVFATQISSSSHQADHEVPLFHTRVWTLVFGLLLSFSLRVF
jgi:hypothetical protein